MSYERMKHLKDCLLCCIENQMSNLEQVDAAELGEAIDMLKDLEEAIYYYTVSEAMTENEYEGGNKKHHEEIYNERYYSSPVLHMDDNNVYTSSHDTRTSNRDWPEKTPSHDSKEGRSYMSRKMYMEAKQTNNDKAMQLRELEKYMQELTNDIVEMIQDSSPEEKSYLEKKMTTLATKIG